MKEIALKVKPTFTLEALSHQSEEHLSTEVAEVGRLVRVDVEDVRPDLELLHRRLSCNGTQVRLHG